jgi:hypothetical protein
MIDVHSIMCPLLYLPFDDADVTLDVVVWCSQLYSVLLLLECMTEIVTLDIIVWRCVLNTPAL